VLGVVLPMDRRVSVPVPLCPSCQTAFRERIRRGGRTGALVGVLLMMGLALPYALLHDRGRFDPWSLLGVLVLVLGLVCGTLLGTVAGRRLPVQLRGYSPTQGTVQVRFGNPDYAARVRELLQTPAPTQPQQ
jgi:hypothetical protein